ncbi:MAG TPA: Ppx/GppA phosphatase family protein [Candidatus Binataceae bacterium]|nr:Ppx/GppA phosphatase family protein [Candidatus Binataceae bacterium]
MKLAALDVGTNTVLMLVVQADPNDTIVPLADLARITRLGAGVERTGALDSDAAARTLDTIAEFVEQARALGARRFLTAATSALREARDGAQFIARVRARCAVELNVISGEEEAALNYQAALDGLHLSPQAPLLIIDIGGGSTEFIASQPGQPLRLASLPIGSVRLTERLVRHDPPTEEERQALIAAVDSQLATLGWPKITLPTTVGVAGTVTTIAALALGLTSYDGARVHGAVLSRAQIQTTVARLLSLTTEQRRQLPTMVEGRADVICAGGLILERALAWFAQDELVASDQGVRWGLVYRDLSHARRP